MKWFYISKEVPVCAVRINANGNEQPTVGTWHSVWDGQLVTQKEDVRFSSKRVRLLCHKCNCWNYCLTC